MNFEHEEFASPSQAVIDRMVDGELSDAEQSDLLRTLEAEPDGWRRLALAYVEAQTFGHEFRQLLSGRAQSAVATVEVPRPSRSSWKRHVLMAAACCFGVALGSGLTWRQLQPVKQSRELADSPPKSEPRTKTGADIRPAVLRKRPTVRMRSDDAQELDVPVVDASMVNPDWLASSGMLPASVRDSLRESGREFEESRHLIPFQLDDGRWGVVPVDEVKFVKRKGWN